MKQVEWHGILNLNLRECREVSQPGRDVNIPAQSVFRSKLKWCWYNNTGLTVHRRRTKIMSQRGVPNWRIMWQLQSTGAGPCAWRISNRCHDGLVNDLLRRVVCKQWHVRLGHGHIGVICQVSRSKVHVFDPFDQQCWARGTLVVQFQGSLSREAAQAMSTAKSARHHVPTRSKAKELWLIYLMGIPQVSR